MFICLHSLFSFSQTIPRKRTTINSFPLESQIPDKRFVITLWFHDSSSPNTISEHGNVEQICSNTSAQLHFSQYKQKRNPKTSVPPKINISSVYMCSVKLPGLISILDRGNCLFRAAEIPEKQIKLPSSISTISLLWSKVQSVSWSSTAAKKLPGEGPELLLNGWERENSWLPNERGVKKKKSLNWIKTREWRDVVREHTWGLKPSRLRRKLI